MNKKGFTLIELVVAIAILGIIMIIAIPSINYIQNNNKDTKYIAYEKAINSAGKAYVDAYNEDLFGIGNTGCAIITYNDLKDRDLVEDIQVKNINCGNEDTFVIVRKNKQGNYHYDTYLTCRSGSKIIYGNGKKPNEIASCGLEDGEGPTVTLIKTPSKDTYYIGDKPTVKIKLEEKGVGLKANQVLTYQWFKGSEVFTEEKTLEFKNINFEDSITRDVEVPSNLENIDEPTNYTLKVTGEVYDLNNNPTTVNLREPFNYFVGKLIIQMKANGGKMIDPHGDRYSIVNDYIVKDSTDKTISTIKYKGKLGSDGLWNYNNSNYVNLGKSNYHINSEKEWKCDATGKEYDQSKQYSVSDFGYQDSDLIKENKTVVVYANWVPNIYTISLDNQGATSAGTKIIYLKYGVGWYSNSAGTNKITSITKPKITVTDVYKVGYKFKGYYSKKSGEGTMFIDENGKILSDKTTSITKNTDLYAYWVKHGWDLTNSLTPLTGQKWKYYENGTPFKNGYIELCSNNSNSCQKNPHYFKDGYAITGWKKYGGHIYYFSDRDADGNGYVDLKAIHDSKPTIDGKKSCFDSNGYCYITGDCKWCGGL